MMFRTLRLNKIFTAVFCIACVLAFAAVCLLILRSGAPDSVTINGENVSLRAEDAGDAGDFIRACGYEAGRVESDREITVPSVWNEVYSGYAALQSGQGFDLSRYRGRPARELIFAADGGDHITLLICDKKIIAAHKSRMDGSANEPLIMRR